MLFYCIPEYSHLRGVLLLFSGVGFVFFFFSYCLFNEVLTEGTAPGVWNFPQPQPATPSTSCGPVSGALQLEQSHLSPFPVRLLLRLLLHWPL